MEPATLLFVEVFGMIGIAAFLTQAIVRDRPVFAGPGGREATLDLTPMATSIFCPEWMATADVTLGVTRTGKDHRLEVLTCDLLMDGETCDGLCMRPVVEA